MSDRSSLKGSAFWKDCPSSFKPARRCSDSHCSPSSAIFVFLKKFIKLFIVLGILGGAFYLLYTQTTIIQDLLSGIMP
ncbi:MAG: hypothetical protein MZU95_14350 [Desulfomicrobium escambiense]|nr:hypothetical protein [Desulfomicrobium escambiense]